MLVAAIGAVVHRALAVASFKLALAFLRQGEADFRFGEGKRSILVAQAPTVLRLLPECPQTLLHLLFLVAHRLSFGI
jgi:hypothetical protein